MFNKTKQKDPLNNYLACWINTWSDHVFVLCFVLKPFSHPVRTDMGDWVLKPVSSYLSSSWAICFNGTNKTKQNNPAVSQIDSFGSRSLFHLTEPVGYIFWIRLFCCALLQSCFLFAGAVPVSEHREGVQQPCKSCLPCHQDVIPGRACISRDACAYPFTSDTFWGQVHVFRKERPFKGQGSERLWAV